jgi:hypothetical protein
MLGKFATRTYYRYGKLRKMYLLHEKVAPMNNIDALLIVHDIPFYEFQCLGFILRSLPSVKKCNISLLEFSWDFYPTTAQRAVDLQKEMVKHLYFKHARRAYSVGEWPRKTFYVNDRASDVFLKTYIRPKKPRKGAREFVRLELTAKRRWLKNIGIEKPPDFRRLDLKEVLRQLVWLDVNARTVRSSYQNLLTGEFWVQSIVQTLGEEGIAKVITRSRDARACPNICRTRGHHQKCQLAAAMKVGASGAETFDAIRRCPHARPLTNFEQRYCRRSREHRPVKRLMRGSYRRWRNQRLWELKKRAGMIPLFPDHVAVAPRKGKERKATPKRRHRVLNTHRLFYSTRQ